MKFVACLATKDEEELIGPSIHHLRRIGVELVIVLDYGSTDRTLDILAEEEGRGDIWLLHSDNETDPTGGQRDIALARETGAEWALFPDTDEFFLPASGSLTTLDDLADADILRVETYDVALSRADGFPDAENMTPDHYADILVYGRGPEPDRWPKIMARPRSIVNMLDGHHGATPAPGQRPREKYADGLMIAHLAFTTLPRFERKVANIRRFHRRWPEWFADGNGSHWLEWLHADDEGRTPEVFANWLLDPAELERLKADGAVCSAAEILATRRHTRVAT